MVNIRRNEVVTVASNPIFIEDYKEPKNALLLQKVHYRIWAKLEFIPKWKRSELNNPLIDNEKKKLLRKDENPGKYNAMFERRASNGQCFNQPYLGTRECVASFRLVDYQKEKLSEPISESRDLGIMLYDLDYDKNVEKPDAMFFRAKMENGVIIVPSRESQEVLK